MEQLTDNLASMLDLTDGETDLLAADPAHAIHPSDDQELSLIGGVVTNTDLSTNFIRANVTRFIRPVKGIDFKILSDNMFVIKFEHPLDRKKAVKGCPWVLDKYALILEQIDDTRKHDEHQLTRLPIIVRVLLLSLTNRSEHAARVVDNSLWWFMEVPKVDDGFYSPYFHFEILVDVNRQPKRGVYFQGVDGVKQWL